MNNYESLSEAIQAWAGKYHLSDKCAFQLIYAAFLSTQEKFNWLKEQAHTTFAAFKDFEDNFLKGYDMNMIEFELRKIVEEVWNETGDNWTIVEVQL